MSFETINVAKDFSETPGGRHKRFGPASGEEFREHLERALKTGNKVTVVLDGAEGYGSSFLEEAFGGLVRIEHWSVEDLKRILTIEAQNKAYKMFVDLSWKYIEDAARRLNA